MAHKKGEIYRQVRTASRAAEAYQKAARSNHVQRLADREAAQKKADYCFSQLKTHGSRSDVDAALRNAEFALKMACVKVDATAAVAAQADAALCSVKQNMEELDTEEIRHALMKDTTAGVNGHTHKTESRDDGESISNTECRTARSSSDWGQGRGQKIRQAERQTRREEKSRIPREEAEDLRVRETSRELMSERRSRHEAQQHAQASSQEHPLPEMPSVYREKQPQAAMNHAQERKELLAEQRASPSVLQTRPQFAHILWKKAFEHAFCDYSAVKVFPEPPKGKCSKLECTAGQSQRILKACACDIETALILLQIPPREARLAWHPDRWTRCPAEHRESFQAKAKEVFVVVMKMYVAENL